MAEKYVRCNSHCKYPAYDKTEVDNLLNNKVDSTKVYSKEEVDNLLNAKHDIHCGVVEPDNTLGQNGDIFLKYNE